jgi:ABC-2 family transporter protein
LTWLAWRQIRPQLLIALALLGALAVLIIVTGLHLREISSTIGGPRCLPFLCGRLTNHYKTLATGLGPMLLAIPALLGMFWGAPLVAGELESGTYRLAWTQSVSRRDWLTKKLTVVGVAAVVITGIADWLVNWWYAPLDAVNLDHLDPSVFTERGFVAIGYTAFAFALGVAAGALIRRTLPALLAALIGFAAARLAVTAWVRPHLLPNSHALLARRAVSSAPIPNAWTLVDKLVRSRSAFTRAQYHDLMIKSCRLIGPQLCRKTPKVHGHIRLRQVTYQPASHYWPLQILETAIFLIAASGLIWITIRQITPRPRVHRSPPERVVRLLPRGTTDVAKPPVPDDERQTHHLTARPFSALNHDRERGNLTEEEALACLARLSHLYGQ